MIPTMLRNNEPTKLFIVTVENVSNHLKPSFSGNVEQIYPAISSLLYSVAGSPPGIVEDDVHLKGNFDWGLVSPEG